MIYLFFSFNEHFIIFFTRFCKIQIAKQVIKCLKRTLIMTNRQVSICNSTFVIPKKNKLYKLKNALYNLNLQNSNNS